LLTNLNLEPNILFLSELSDRKFIGTYRLSKQLVEELIDTLTNNMNSPMTSSGITIKRQVSIYILIIDHRRMANLR